MQFTSVLIVLCALALQSLAAPAPGWAGVKPRVPTKGNPGTINGQIVGGTLATAGQFRHQAHLLIDNAALCGGSLISNRWVLTAAHCAINRVRFIVRLGTLNWRLAATSEPNRQTFNTTVKIVHAQYNTSKLYNDVALVQLNTAAVLNTYVNTVTLPKYSDAAKNYTGFTATASGWGWTKDNGTASDVLNWVNLPIITNTLCKATYGNLIINSTICVSGAGAKSTCRGDSGGPLTVVDGGVTKLVGVTSFGSQSCSSGAPQAFARVTSFLDWIKTNTGIAIAA